jgi:hypothetical protein
MTSRNAFLSSLKRSHRLLRIRVTILAIGLAFGLSLIPSGQVVAASNRCPDAEASLGTRANHPKESASPVSGRLFMGPWPMAKHLTVETVHSGARLVAHCN